MISLNGYTPAAGLWVTNATSARDKIISKGFSPREEMIRQFACYYFLSTPTPHVSCPQQFHLDFVSCHLADQQQQSFLFHYFFTDVLISISLLVHSRRLDPAHVQLKGRYECKGTCVKWRDQHIHQLHTYRESTAKETFPANWDLNNFFEHAPQVWLSWHAELEYK